MENITETPSDLQNFDPFSDRRSRDIRNQLSNDFVDAIQTMDAAVFERAVKKMMADHPQGVYHDYIDRRLSLYRQAYEQISSGEVSNPRLQIPILWNHGLFFELHELVEEMWRQAKGPLKEALKGLIQAAGVYVHIEQGNRAAAATLAQRAIKHLQIAGKSLSFVDSITELVEKLHRLDLPPVHLKPAENDKKSA